jgi:hypothetical protein
MLLLRVLGVFTIGLSALCHAEPVRILEIASDGTLSGLPSEYLPSAMRIQFSQPDPRARPVSSFELVLGKQRVRLPPCVTAVLNTRQLKDVKVFASLRPEQTAVPPYMTVEFFDPNYKPKALFNPGYSLLFNLRTARLIEMEVLIVRERGKVLQHLPLDLASMCSPAELATFKDGVKSP